MAAELAAHSSNGTNPVRRAAELAGRLRIRLSARRNAYCNERDFDLSLMLHVKSQWPRPIAAPASFLSCRLTGVPLLLLEQQFAVLGLRVERPFDRLRGTLGVLSGYLVFCVRRTLFLRDSSLRTIAIYEYTP